MMFDDGNESIYVSLLHRWITVEPLNCDKSSRKARSTLRQLIYSFFLVSVAFPSVLVMKTHVDNISVLGSFR
jgi:hypothetical protein